jgi:hypothetical protein
MVDTSYKQQITHHYQHNSLSNIAFVKTIIISPSAQLMHSGHPRNLHSRISPIPGNAKLRNLTWLNQAPAKAALVRLRIPVLAVTGPAKPAILQAPVAATAGRASKA